MNVLQRLRDELTEAEQEQREHIHLDLWTVRSLIATLEAEEKRGLCTRCGERHNVHIACNTDTGR